MNESRPTAAPGRPPVLDAIGHTPIVRLGEARGARDGRGVGEARVPQPDGLVQGPDGARDGRGAEARGALHPGETIVEYTGGSTGSSLAFVCAVKGYRLRIVSSDAFAAEKIRTMRAFGAERRVHPQPAGDPARPDPVDDAAGRGVVAETGGYPTDQFNNRDMLDGYAALARRSRTTPRSGRRVRRLHRHGGLLPRHDAGTPGRVPGVRRVGVEPAESPVLAGGEPGTHRIEGGGAGFWPPQLTGDDLDAIEAVSTDDAMAMARRAAREEGLWSGPSTGANLVAALRVARELGEGRRVVTVLVDSGLKYLGGSLYA